MIRSKDKMELEADIKGHARSFEFDRVFGPTADNTDVFDEVKALVTSFMDGYVASKAHPSHVH